MSPRGILLLNLALACYNLGTIWAHEVDIFRSWALLDAVTFRAVQAAHWRKLPYWVFTPVGLSLMGAIVLLWVHPTWSPGWAIWSNLICQVLAHILTAVMWGPWQAALSRDPRGPSSPFLTKILQTHWIRTVLMSACAVILCFWAAGVQS